MRVTLNDINPGVVYLTIGTTTEIGELFTGQDVRFNILLRPTTKQIRAVMQPSLLSDFSSQDEVVIIIPTNLEGTGNPKPPSTRKRKTTKATEEKPGNLYKLPNDIHFSVPDSHYCFVVASEVDGTITKESKSAIKKLEGGAYQILDLTGNVEEVCEAAEVPSKARLLVESLLTLEGVQSWSKLTYKEFFKYFLIPTKYIPILNAARAWDLTLWIKPFITKIELAKDMSNRHAIMGLFAYWVYCSTYYWADDYNKGLHHSSYKKAGVTYNKLAFYPSTKAKMEWVKILESIGV